MLRQPAPGTERLLIQPIVIPRSVDLKGPTSGVVRFFVVMAFQRFDGNHLHPRTQRKFSPIDIPECLRGSSKLFLPSNGRTYGNWPSFIESGFASGFFRIRFFESENSEQEACSTTGIRLRRPADLAASGWDVRRADELWNRLIVPKAMEAQVVADASGGNRSAIRTASFRLAAERRETGEVDPTALARFAQNPITATDLRPNLRLESVDTRGFIRQMKTFVSATSDDPDDEETLIRKLSEDTSNELRQFVERRDPTGDLASLLAALQRDDRRFHHEILPRLKTTDQFHRDIRTLSDWRQEYLLEKPHGEVLRQTRFVDSGIHRSTITAGGGGVGGGGPAGGDLVAKTVALAADDGESPSDSFEDYLAGLRQHPGLMRRLYLTVQCEIDYDAAMSTATRDRGAVCLAISPQFTADDYGFVTLSAKTLYTMSTGRQGPLPRHFRPAPTDDSFYGRKVNAAAARNDFLMHHTLGTDLYQATQDDPTLGMLRAAQSLGDANQSARDQMRDPDGKTAAQATAADDLPTRVNAINIYHRVWKADDHEGSVLDMLVATTEENSERLAMYNTQLSALAKAVKRNKNPFQYASLVNIAEQRGAQAPALFSAENLMLGYTVHIQRHARTGGPGESWRHLNRRQVELFIDAAGKTPEYRLAFEEEGCLTSAIVVPPRPQTGEVKRIDETSLTLSLLGVDNTPEGNVTFRLVPPGKGEAETDFINGFRLFIGKGEQLKPIVGDTVLIAPRASAAKSNPGEVPVADHVFVHPVLMEPANLLRDCVTKRIPPLGAPAVLECRMAPRPPRDAPIEAPIVYAPHSTRLVDWKGAAVELNQIDANQPARVPEDEFVAFNAETVERLFAQLIPTPQDPGETPSPSSAMTPVLTSLGPANQVLLGQLGGAALSDWWLPDPDAVRIEAQPPLNPLPQMTDDLTRKTCRRVARLTEEKLFAVRGLVQSIGFVFALDLTRSKPSEGPSHEVRVKDEQGITRTWYAAGDLKVSLIERGPALTPDPIVCDSGTLSSNLTQASAVLRGIVKVGVSSAGSPESIAFVPKGVEFSTGGTAVSAAGNTIPGGIRWTLDLELLSGGQSTLLLDFENATPPEKEKGGNRFIHPLLSRGTVVEALTQSPGRTVRAMGWIQRPLGTLVADLPVSTEDADKTSDRMRFADGAEFRFRSKRSPWKPATNRKSGFMIIDSQMIERDAQGVLQFDSVGIEEEALLIVGEVVRADASSGHYEVEFTDLFGRNWIIRETANWKLPVGVYRGSIRRLIQLLPGELTIGRYHLDDSSTFDVRRLIPAPHADALEFAPIETALLGRFSGGPLGPIEKAAEGGVRFRPAQLQTWYGRTLSVWCDRTSGGRTEIVSAWSKRMAVAVTISSLKKPVPPPVAARQVGAFADGPQARPSPPQHIMVSELITRWSNWALGVAPPGKADQGPDASQQTQGKKPLRYRTVISRPRREAMTTAGQPPFDEANWLLPALRFGDDYRICLRRVDLAGNHLYDESPIPSASAAGPGSELTFASRLQSLVDENPGRFARVNLPTGAMIAFTPERSTPVLVPRDAPAQPARTDVEARRSADQFLYFVSRDRTPALVLLSDALGGNPAFEHDACLEVLPPPIDIESLILHGVFDTLPPFHAAGLIQTLERHLDTPAESRVLGRLRGDGMLNYAADPMASRLTVTVMSPQTSPVAAKPIATTFFRLPGNGSQSPLRAWPDTRWIRMVLRSSERRRRTSADAYSLIPPKGVHMADGSTFSVYLPPGATGKAVLSVRPPALDPTPSDPVTGNAEYARMVRDHGSDERKVDLIHATNAPWTRPEWSELAETPRDPEEGPATLRTFDGKVALDLLSTGFISATAYWNDPWDELVSAQHEPATAIVEVDEAGKAVAAKLLDGGVGFGSAAVVLFDAAGLPFRKPTFRAALRNGRLVALTPVDPGIGCLIRFRICVRPAAWCIPCGWRPALAEAHHDERGRLVVRVIDAGECLGPSAEIHVLAERPDLPRLNVELADGAVRGVALAHPGGGGFAGPLKARIIRRPPFYRVAEARISRFALDGGIVGLELLDGGGWYASPPHCIVHDPAGDGFGAELHARLDEFGGVICVDVLCRGRGYSDRSRVEFYTDLAEIPEQAIEAPTVPPTDPVRPFPFQQRFPNAWGRRVDFFARAMSRFRAYLVDDLLSKENRQRFATGERPPIRTHIPRVSPVRTVDVRAHLEPVKPEPAYMMPSFHWEPRGPLSEDAMTPETYFAERDSGSLTIARMSRIRVYLRRPWNMTGPETLAVVLQPAITNTTASTRQEKLSRTDGGVFNPAAAANAAPAFREEPVGGYAIDDELRPFVSRWGFDPVWNEAAFPPLTVDQFPQRHPVTVLERLSAADAPPVSVVIRRPIALALHDVHYDSVKDLWYSDIEIDISAGGPPRTAVPFVRLNLARYQPLGFPGHRLSPVSICDMYKLLGRRLLKVDRTGRRSFAVTLSGEFDVTPKPTDFPRRQVVVRLEARDPDLSPEIVHHLPPPTAKGAGRQTNGVVAEVPLVPNARGDAYAADLKFSEEVWQSAVELFGKPSIAVLSILEFEIFPCAETQSAAADTEFLILDDRACARRLVFSSSLQLNIPRNPS
jgi:hypothetical protein